MYTNVINISLRGGVTVSFTLMYDNFESYLSGNLIDCNLISGAFYSDGGQGYSGVSTGCLYIFKDLFYNSFERATTGHKEYSCFYDAIREFGYNKSSALDVYGTGGLYNFGSLGGTGTNISGVLSEGYIQSGFYFNSGYISYPHHPSMLLNNFTIEFQMKRSEWTDTYARLIDKNYLTAFAVTRANASDNMNFNILGTDNFSNATVSQDTWTHVACVRSGSQGTIYISGLFDSSFSIPSAQFTSTDVFAMGQDRSTFPGSENYKGYIDEVRLWNYARSSDEISGFYDKKLEFKDLWLNTGLLIYFSFDQSLTPVGSVYVFRSYLYDNFEMYLTGSGIVNSFASGVFINGYNLYTGLTTGGLSQKT